MSQEKIFVNDAQDMLRTKSAIVLSVISLYSHHVISEIWHSVYDKLCKTQSCLLFLNPVLSDTLLNVFLAIAVDNLANAQELTKVKHNFSVSDSPFL